MGTGELVQPGKYMPHRSQLSTCYTYKYQDPPAHMQKACNKSGTLAQLLGSQNLAQPSELQVPGECFSEDKVSKQQKTYNINLWLSRVPMQTLHSLVQWVITCVHTHGGGRGGREGGDREGGKRERAGREEEGERERMSEGEKKYQKRKFLSLHQV